MKTTAIKVVNREKTSRSLHYTIVWIVNIYFVVRSNLSALKKLKNEHSVPTQQYKCHCVINYFYQTHNLTFCLLHVYVNNNTYLLLLYLLIVIEMCSFRHSMICLDISIFRNRVA